MFKKLFLLLVLAIPFLVSAQNSSEPALKVEAGQQTLEVQFTPFGNTPININGVRARWFSSDSKAFRLNAFIGIDSDTGIIQQENSDTGAEELKSVSTEIALSLRPGFEKHLSVSDRLSPYFGMEFELAYQTFTLKEESQDGSTVNYFKFINNGQAGFVRLGANALAGIDYYVAKKLYLGTEFGFGFSYTGFLSAKVKSDASGFDEPDPIKQGSAFDLGPNVVAQIRLGYAF